MFLMFKSQEINEKLFVVRFRPAPKDEDEMMVAIFECVDRLFGIVRPRKVRNNERIYIREIFLNNCLMKSNSNSLKILDFVHGYRWSSPKSKNESATFKKI